MKRLLRVCSHRKSSRELLSALIMASATPAASLRGQSVQASDPYGIRGLCRHPQWPQVADAVIEALLSTSEASWATTKSVGM